MIQDSQAQVTALTVLCERIIDVHAQVVMDTPEDRELHARAVQTFRDLLAIVTGSAGSGDSSNPPEDRCEECAAPNFGGSYTCGGHAGSAGSTPEGDLST